MQAVKITSGPYTGQIGWHIDEWNIDLCLKSVDVMISSNSCEFEVCQNEFDLERLNRGLNLAFGLRNKSAEWHRSILNRLTPIEYDLLCMINMPVQHVRDVMVKHAMSDTEVLQATIAAIAAYKIKESKIIEQINNEDTLQE